MKNNYYNDMPDYIYYELKPECSERQHYGKLIAGANATKDKDILNYSYILIDTNITIILNNGCVFSVNVI